MTSLMTSDNHLSIRRFLSDESQRAVRLRLRPHDQAVQCDVIASERTDFESDWPTVTASSPDRPHHLIVRMTSPQDCCLLSYLPARMDLKRLRLHRGLQTALLSRYDDEHITCTCDVADFAALRDVDACARLFEPGSSRLRRQLRTLEAEERLRRDGAGLSVIIDDAARQDISGFRDGRVHFLELAVDEREEKIVARRCGHACPRHLAAGSYCLLRKQRRLVFIYVTPDGGGGGAGGGGVKSQLMMSLMKLQFVAQLDADFGLYFNQTFETTSDEVLAVVRDLAVGNSIRPLCI